MLNRLIPFLLLVTVLDLLTLGVGWLSFVKFGIAALIAMQYLDSKSYGRGNIVGATILYSLVYSFVFQINSGIVLLSIGCGLLVQSGIEQVAKITKLNNFFSSLLIINILSLLFVLVEGVEWGWAILFSVFTTIVVTMFIRILLMIRVKDEGLYIK